MESETERCITLCGYTECLPGRGRRLTDQCFYQKDIAKYTGLKCHKYPVDGSLSSNLIHSKYKNQGILGENRGI